MEPLLVLGIKLNMIDRISNSLIFCETKEAMKTLGKEYGEVMNGLTLVYRIGDFV
ncbi:hypothetical protein NBRC110019_27620 [Neptunitalea chrysea]|uniref:Uncharacterized protein n=1 Tax=Neptunitalea chrysea TaxID=1647581 RepID=A0A9W6EW32_9FLAO|nr:hypothetical protein [Neptunitalea chrysea]GLB53721.1 hypothetical protein NBRC110019_27620 [Neptunitalea chrysea]